MPRVTRSSSRKAQLDDSEVSEDKGSKTEPGASKHTKTVQENDHAVSSDSDDDEAPESIPLSASKQAAIAEIHKEKETLQALKEKERQQRRERDEFFKKQKESRKARELSRLPADILEKVAQKHEMVAMQQKEIKGTDATVSMHVNFDSDDEEEEENVTQLAVNEEQKGVQVVVLSQASKNKKRVLDSASEFLKNHFYGDRLKRVETLDDENQKRKRRTLGPAIQFSKTASKT